MPVTLEDVAYRILPRVTPGCALADVEWRTLARAAETLLDGSPAQLTPEQVADNVEQYLCTGRSRRAWRIRVLLTIVEYSPLCRGELPFSLLSAEARRRFVQQHWVSGSGVFGLCARVRLLAIMGTYGDRRSWDSIGFVPIAQRPRFARGMERPGRASLHERGPAASLHAAGSPARPS